MAQNTVEIINVKRSTVSGKTFESTVYETLWRKNEAKLRSQGWLLKSDIDSVEIIKVDDGLGLNEVELIEAEAPVVAPEDKSLEDMTLAELKEKCKADGVKFHHANKKAKLIELLRA